MISVSSVLFPGLLVLGIIGFIRLLIGLGKLLVRLDDPAMVHPLVEFLYICG